MFPFNALCPEVEVFADAQCTKHYTKNTSIEVKEQSAEGCTAVALAIVMKHHKFPKATTAEIPARMNHVYETQYNNDAIWERFSDPAIAAGTVLEWDKTLDDYYERDANGDFAEDGNGQVVYKGTYEQQRAVANLMRVAASAVGTQYGHGDLAGSTTNDEAMIDGVKKYLKFPNIALHHKDDYNTPTEFQQALYNELKVAGAVFFTAQNKEGGHAFVIDGYTNEDIFSINWGWGGMCNGNYRLNSADPEYQGRKLSQGGGYNEEQKFFSGLYADAPSGIVELKDATRHHTDKTYDLQGRQVTGKHQGIVICDGRKMVSR